MNNILNAEEAESKVQSLRRIVGNLRGSVDVARNYTTELAQSSKAAFQEQYSEILTDLSVATEKLETLTEDLSRATKVYFEEFDAAQAAIK